MAEGDGEGASSDENSISEVNLGPGIEPQKKSPKKKGPDVTLDVYDRLKELAEVSKRKPYSNPKNRPNYGEGQVEEVWETAKQPDGNVYDPNTGELLEWDQTKPRRDQWDMGHKPGKEYRKLHKDYMDGKITKEEFLKEFRNPNNYQPEAPSSNRSHQYEEE